MDFNHQALKKTLSRRRAARHNKPDLIFQLIKLQPLLDLLRTHCWEQYWLKIVWITALERHIPPGISCLLANTSSSASFISRSSIILCSSWRASSIRDRSFESITKIRPCVPTPSCMSKSASLNFSDLYHTRKVMSPQRPDLVLPTHIPHIELNVLVSDCLDVEADRGDRGNVLVELQFVKNSWSI